MKLEEKTWGEVYRNTVVCVDSYEEGAMKGRFFNPYLEQGESFASLSQFLLKMEKIMNEMNFPQASTKIRHFSSASASQFGDIPEDPTPRGKVGTFYVRILFRQNTSWQGTVTWSDTGEQRSFRSVLELVQLMDSALNQEKVMV